MKKYYYISYRIKIPNSTPSYEYCHELIDMTPLEYVLYWKGIGGDYSERIILFSEETNHSAYIAYKNKFE